MTNIIKEYVDNTFVKSSVFLLKFRLWFNVGIYLFMIFMAYILLRIDFLVVDDPLIRQYHYNRWLLITTWFNLISMVYTPICIYCDWREIQGTSETKHVKFLSQVRFVCFSSILYPATAFSDILFWKLWFRDRELVMPQALDALVPFWIQHSLHTMSLVVVMLDLFLVPRRRPKNLAFGAGLLAVFLTIYGVVCADSIIREEHIYPLLKRFSGYMFIPLVIFVSVEHFLYFTTMWFIIDYVWGRKNKFSQFLSVPTLNGNVKMEMSEAKRVN